MMRTLLARMVNEKHHFTAWFAYGIYFFAINRLTNDQLSWMQVWLMIPLFAVIFYGVLALLNRLYAKGKKVQFFLLLLVFYLHLGVIIFLFWYQGAWSVLHQGRYIIEQVGFSGYEFLQSLLVVFGNYSIFAIVYYNFRKKTKEMKKRHEAEMWKKKYEYVSLAGQVSPHLMANLFAKWEEDFRIGKAEAVKEVSQAYDLMVFYMEASALGSKRVTLLADEVKQLQRYQEMLMASSDLPKCIEFTIQGSVEGKVIPPTTLISLLENANKHGLVDDPMHPVRLSLVCSESSIKIECKNWLVTKLNVPSHGTGLSNLRRRLELHYGSAVSFHVKSQNNQYSVNINIQI